MVPSIRLLTSLKRSLPMACLAAHILLPLAAQSDDSDLTHSDTAKLNGPDFVYDGQVELAHGGGRFATHIENTPGPFNAAFTGIIDGRFVLCWSYESIWTRRNGSQLTWPGIEFVGFELLALPDGSFAPDFSRPSKAQIFETVDGGTGRYRYASGVGFHTGTFLPTGSISTSAKVTGEVVLSHYCAH